MRESNGVAILGASMVLIGATATPTLAYDPQHTHRWLTRQAIERLVEAYPGQYDELLTYADEVAAGVEEEDDELLDGDMDPTTLRVQRHFFRPTDGAGLSMWERAFPSSFEWALVPDPTNAWGWDDGRAAWRAGDKARAYRTLGHVVHLVQDATVPAHTHLDVHGPPTGDDYEGWCSRQTTSEYHSALPLPPPGAPIPVFADAHDAWMRTARASYARNFYPGDLSDQAAAKGVIAEMFPDLGWSWFFEEWRIGDPAVGALGSDFLEEQPGMFYFENTQYAAAVDRVGFDPADPFAATFGANPSGAPMNELMARDLVPVAVLHSAGVMKLYLDEMYATPVDPPADDPGGDDDGAPGAPAACAAAPGAEAPGAGAAAVLLVLAALTLNRLDRSLRRRKR
jgi:hypothetical protein